MSRVARHSCRPAKRSTAAERALSNERSCGTPSLLGPFTPRPPRNHATCTGSNCCSRRHQEPPFRALSSNGDLLPRQFSRTLLRADRWSRGQPRKIDRVVDGKQRQNHKRHAGEIPDNRSSDVHRHSPCRTTARELSGAPRPLPSECKATLLSAFAGARG